MPGITVFARLNIPSKTALNSLKLFDTVYFVPIVTHYFGSTACMVVSYPLAY